MRLKLRNNISVLFLASLLLFIPLPKAGMIDWALLAFNFLVVGALFFHICENNYSLVLRNSSKPANDHRPWLLVLFTVSGWVLFQLLITSSVIGWDLYLPSDTPRPMINAGPINALESLHYWAMFCAYWSLAFIVSRLKLKQYKILLWALSLSFSFQIVYGLLAYFSESNTYIGLWQKYYYTSFATGTFVNHNHYAGFLAVCWPLFLSFFTLPEKHGGVKLPDTARWVVVAFISLLCLVALLASASRMGLAVGLAGVSLWAWYFSAKQLKLSKQWRLLIMVSIWTLLLIIGLWFGLAEIIERFQRLWIVETRWELWQATFDLPIHAWIWGVGAGNFADVYTLVHPTVAVKTAQEAHNDYLQFILEFGIVGSSLILSTGIYWLYKCFPRQEISLIRWGALSGIIAIALHSLVDFNLQIPGTAVYFWLAVGCVMNTKLDKPKHRVRTD